VPIKWFRKIIFKIQSTNNNVTRGIEEEDVEDEEEAKVY